MRRIIDSGHRSTAAVGVSDASRASTAAALPPSGRRFQYTRPSSSSVPVQVRSN
eukprot:ctg_225.g82